MNLPSNHREAGQSIARACSRYKVDKTPVLPTELRSIYSLALLHFARVSFLSFFFSFESSGKETFLLFPCRTESKNSPGKETQHRVEEFISILRPLSY